MRRQKNKLDKERVLMRVAFVVFLLEVCIAVVGNTLFGHGWHINYSISRYVGLETWSALVFALGNFVVAIAMLYYLYGVGENLGVKRGFFWIIVMIVIGLIGLSMCPSGYFDPSGMDGRVSSISLLHLIFARMMFAMMLIIVAWVLFCERATLATRLTAAMFVAYGTIYVSGYLLGARWIKNYGFLYESIYLVGFMLWCLGCRVIKEGRENGTKQNREAAK